MNYSSRQPVCTGQNVNNNNNEYDNNRRTKYPWKTKRNITCLIDSHRKDVVNGCLDWVGKKIKVVQKIAVSLSIAYNCTLTHELIKLYIMAARLYGQNINGDKTIKMGVENLSLKNRWKTKKELDKKSN